jgi:hypothetical protein
VLILSKTADGAIVNTIQGNVFINKGDGFSPILSAGTVEPGDKILAERGGSASLVYNANCTVPVRPGSLITVMDQPPCGASNSTNSNAVQGGADAPTGFATGPISPMLLLGGAAAAAAGVAADLLLTNNSSDPTTRKSDPISP